MKVEILLNIQIIIVIRKKLIIIEFFTKMAINEPANPELPLLEEIKIGNELDQQIRLTKSVSDSIVYKARNSLLRDREEDTPEGDNLSQMSRVSQIHYISKKLISMGFDHKMVHALLINNNISDLQTSVEMLMKTELGYPHQFIPANDSSLCEICAEPYQEHLEANINEQRVSQIITKKEEEVNIEKLISEKPEEKEGPRCDICMEVMTVDNKFALGCGHYFCKNCVANYLNENINNGKVMDLKCPHGDCESKFARHDIEIVSGSEIAEKYQKFYENIEVNLDKNKKWCPAPNCGRVIIKTSKRNHIVCECGFHMCFKCGEAWHGRVSCAKNYENLYKDWASEKEIQRCPHCNIRIEKNEGCNHMTCAFCKFEWCWLCGQTYSYSHFDSTSLFGCPLFQFTSSDWSLKRIAIYQFVIVLFWYLFCFYWAIVKVVDLLGSHCDCFEDCSCLLNVLFKITAFLILVPIYTAISIIPVFFYRLYVLFYIVVRAIRR